MSKNGTTDIVTICQWADEVPGGPYAGETLFAQDKERRVGFRTRGGPQAGFINGGSWNPIIGNVHEKFRQLGVSAELLRSARVLEPSPIHSKTPSSDAQAWIAVPDEVA